MSNRMNDELATRYFRLDAMRSYFVEEICSSAALWDLLWFAAWIGVGFLVEEVASSSPHGFMPVTEVWSLLWTAAVISGLIFNNWWLLALGIGGVLSFLERDRRNGTWDECENQEYLRIAYIANQRFAQILCPIQAAWWIVASLALDRLYGVVPDCPSTADPYSWRWFLWKLCRRDFDKEGLFGLGRHKRPEVKVWISSEDFWSFEGEIPEKHEVTDCCEDSGGEDSDEDSEEPREELEAKGQTQRSIAGNEEKRFVMVYNSQGQHLEGRGPRLSFEMAELRDDTFHQIKKAYDKKEILLLDYWGDGDEGAPKPMLYTSKPETDCIGDRMCRPELILLPFLLAAFLCFTILHLFLVGQRSFEEIVTDFNLYLLLFPSLATVLLQNETHQPDIPDTGINETAAKRSEELLNVFSQGTKCLYSGEDGNHRFRTFLAVSDSSLFFVGCSLTVLLTCFRLQRVKSQLQELDELLQPIYSEEDPHIHAILLYRLHSIRSKVTHKRCLKFVAEHELPILLKKDDTLAWWFATRSAIFQSTRFELTQRTPILVICFIGEALLIVNTFLAHFDYLPDSWPNNFTFTCYSVVTGLIFGSIMLAFFILGHQVNSQLESGLWEVARMNLEDMESEHAGESDGGSSPRSALRSPSPFFPSIRSRAGRPFHHRTLSRTLDRLGRGLPSHPPPQSPEPPDPEVQQQKLNKTFQSLLEYELNHPLIQTFTGCKLNANYVWASASTLGTLAVPVLLEIGQSVVDHVFK